MLTGLRPPFISKKFELISLKNKKKIQIANGKRTRIKSIWQLIWQSIWQYATRKEM